GHRAEALAPAMSAAGFELRDKDLGNARALERAAAEIDRTVETPGYHRVTLLVDRDGPDVDPIAERLAPEVVPGGIELRHEDGSLGLCALQRAAAEVDGVAEAAGEEHVVLTVDGDVRLQPGVVVEE